jgi:hypothetical protein
MPATIEKPIGYRRPVGRQIEQTARAIVDAHSHFYRRANQFEFFSYDGVLVVRGNVPSFYLKQMLQTALQELRGTCRIDNQVAVVSSFGLSSGDPMCE